MAVNSENFPWTSHCGHYNFFETQMDRHQKVSSLKPERIGVYQLKRTQGDTLRVFICECYAFGVAEYIETIGEIGKLEVVIINSAWCGYTPDAKRYCRDDKVGLFKVGEFMAALNRIDYWLYLTDEEKEYFEKHGWL